MSDMNILLTGLTTSENNGNFSCDWVTLKPYYYQNYMGLHFLESKARVLVESEFLGLSQRTGIVHKSMEKWKIFNRSMDEALKDELSIL